MSLISRADAASPRLRVARPLGVSWARASVVIVAVLCGIHVLRPDGWFGQTTYLTVTIGASVVAWLSVRRGGPSSRFWLAVGISASALADVVYQVYVLVRNTEPDVSIADAPWIASYVAVGLGMLQLLRGGHRRTRRDLDALIDMAVIALIAVLILWQFWISASISDTTVPLFVRSVWASYPILDAILLAVVLRTLFELRSSSTDGDAARRAARCAGWSPTSSS